MALDITLEEVMSWAGHSGEAIVFDKFVGFHPQEFVFKALKRGYALVFIEVNPSSVVKDYPNYNRDAVLELMKDRRMVLVGWTSKGNPHAVAWDPLSQMVFDPEGEIRPFGGFEIEYALVVGC